MSERWGKGEDGDGDLVGGNKVRSLNTGNRDVGSDDIKQAVDTRKNNSLRETRPFKPTKVSSRRSGVKI